MGRWEALPEAQSFFLFTSTGGSRGLASGTTPYTSLVKTSQLLSQPWLQGRLGNRQPAKADGKVRLIQGKHN